MRMVVIAAAAAIGFNAGAGITTAGAGITTAGADTDVDVAMGVDVAGCTGTTTSVLDKSTESATGVIFALGRFIVYDIYIYSNGGGLRVYMACKT